SAGALCFLVRAAGYVGQRDEFLVRERVAEVAHDFELSARSELHGRVVDFETGDPVAGANVRLGIDVMLTDESGFFSSSSTAALDRATDRWPTYALQVQAAGHASLFIEMEGLVPPVVARLPRGARITGTIHDAGGRPVAGMRVALQNAWDFSE